MEDLEKLVSDGLANRTNPDNIVNSLRPIIENLSSDELSKLTNYGDAKSQHDAIIRVAAILESER